MKRNKRRLIGTKLFLQLAKKCLLILFLTKLAFYGVLNAQTPKIWPAEISFNYDEGGSSNDAVTIKENASTTISAPEYLRSENSVIKSENCAYIKSQGNRKIKVKFNSNNSNMNYLVKATVISGTGLGNICEMFVAPCDLNTTVFTIDIQGTIPSSVGKNTFTWKWEATALPINSPYCPVTCVTVNTEHTYYTLLSIPQEPMPKPWTDVLDYACDWALNQSSETNTVQKIVEGLYNESGFKYDVVDGSPRYTGWTTQDFNLGYMISDLNSSSSDIIVNCYDMGKAVDIMSRALGCNTDYALSYPFGYLNCIKPIGRGWANNPFYEAGYPWSSNPIVGEDDDMYDGRSYFGNHAFCELYSNIYDACLKVDTDDNPDAPPHSNNNNGTWAIGWSWGTYKDNVIDDNPSSSPPSETANYTYKVY